MISNKSVSKSKSPRSEKKLIRINLKCDEIYDLYDEKGFWEQEGSRVTRFGFTP
jgi:hypothetical protein